MLAPRTLTAAVAAALATSCATSGFAQWTTVAYVDAQGRQWRQLDSTRGRTWFEVAAMCPVDGLTPCTGMIYSQNITGWVWATRDQVEALLVELGAEVGVPDCATGSSADGAVFQYFNSTTSFDLLSLVDGWTSSAWDAVKGSGFAYAPSVRFDQDSLVASTCVRTIDSRDHANSDRGVWLFRPPCIADLDLDGAVGPSDLALLLGSWGGGGPADLSRNGVVGAEDLSIMLASWGAGN